jgi:sulfur carrier protein ThiS
MTTVRLRCLPNGNGNGLKNITPGMTLGDFARQYSLTDRDIVVAGNSVAKDDWDSFYLNGGERIIATTSVKGA